MKITALLISLLMVSCNFAYAECTSVRDKQGKIKRSSYQVKKFKKANPCPVTNLSTGRCPGYEVDHIVPLACCGADTPANTPANTQWLTIKQHDIKTITDNKECRL